MTLKGYRVELVVDVEKSEILVSRCHDCIAALGGVKHQLAFLGWVHRRSEEPTPTEVECYWRKGKLSRVGTTEKFILC